MRVPVNENFLKWNKWRCGCKEDAEMKYFFRILFLLIFWETNNFQDEQLKFFLTSGSILEYLHAQCLTKHRNILTEGNYSFPVVRI